LPLSIGFLLPAYLLLRLALTEAIHRSAHISSRWRATALLLAALTAIIAVTLAVLLAYGARLSKGCWRRHSIAWSAWATPYPAR
jgi:iron(III) transport system permease protein